MMKKFYLSLIVLMTCQLAIAQYSDKGFSFQGYAIDGDNKALASTGITVRFTIYRTGVSFVEEHTTTSDAFGIFSASVGKGTASSSVTFGELNFNNFDYNLKVDVKETTGGTYVTISDKSLDAVPYARSAYNGVPVGTVVPFAGPSTAIPDGWLLCDGTALNASTNLKYAQLFAAIGNTWGGSNSTDFKVPDLRGMFLRGLNTSSSGSDAGRILGSFQSEAIQSHNHGASASNNGSHTHTLYSSKGTIGNNADDGSSISAHDNPNFEDRTTSSNGDHTHTITVAASGGPETRPANYAVNYIIKY